MKSRTITLRLDPELYRFLRQEMVDTDVPNLSELIRSILEAHKEERTRRETP